MIVAATIQEQLERASWIRRMFEEGARLQAERGAANVFDFTLGNPDLDPPQAVVEALREAAAAIRPGIHGYMNNAGYGDVRAVIADRLARATGLGYTANHVLMTVGSSGAINTVLKAMLDPGDEVIVLAPYFPEYRFYIENHAGRVVTVETRRDFQPDIERIGAALTPRTRAIILNSPNNPTGVVYSAEVLAELDAMLARAANPAVVITDEPYRAIVFDGVNVPETPALVRRCVTATSWSKAWAVSGERIGYLAISPRIEEADALRNACTFTNRILGYINAPAIWQRVIMQAADARPEVAEYGRRRETMCATLERIGYKLARPQGTFYVFPESPIADDIAFIRELLREGILAVPGSGFGRAGYFRLALTAPCEKIERASPGFERAFRRCGSATTEPQTLAEPRS
jgi:aspartate aminotransferase